MPHSGNTKQKLNTGTKAMSMCDNYSSNNKNGHGKENNEKLHQTASVHSEENTQEAVDGIDTITLEEVTIHTSDKPSPNKKNGKENDGKKHHYGIGHNLKKACSPHPGKKGNKDKAANIPSKSTTSGLAMIQPEGAAGDIVRSGHIELDTIFASNDSEVGRQPITVNVVNAPNNSTVQCGCDNINCPFCNLILSIQKTDPTVLQ